ncbi:CHAT domain-containing protein [Streptomyces europaeiscabiei]|uniref:CHAT domain-containing protein n=1 Tax=Streptomyces europaeiscabiei TaxID=146819 RepID=UPI0029A231B0|nr:CHAT domain-containing protein [Streptomyces europaeiscabiei]MDX3866838.1 CHAT domain-containing protein [Streptomyces europaeiscabiei]MDX3873133.1 CHAT domain-containing protein [Streptomyces europaeiscabiei]
MDDGDVDFVVRISVDQHSAPLSDSPNELWCEVSAIDDAGCVVRAQQPAVINPVKLSSDMRKGLAANDPQVRKVGNALLPSDVLGAYHLAVDRAQQRGVRLRVCVVIYDERLGVVPWELASVPERCDGATHAPQFLVRHRGVSVVRCIEGSASPLAAHPLDLRGTLLVGTALTVHGRFQTPDGMTCEVSPLKGGAASAAETRTAAAQLGDQGSRDVRILAEPLTPAALREALREPVWGVFFAGHGHRDGIALAVADGEPELMPGPELASLLVNAGVAVVVLAACSTASPISGGPDLADAGSAAWSPHLAEQLVRAGVPYVLGMDGLIGDQHAVRLTEQFFETLTWSGSVDQATHEARLTMTHDWWQPVVYTCQGAPRQLTVPAPMSAPPETLRACHVPPDWRADQPWALPGDSRPARLDILWCLDRGPLRGVLVDVGDAPDADSGHLAAQLNDVEAGPLRLLTTYGGPLRRRHWFGVRESWHEPHRDPGEFAHLLVRPRFLRHALADDPQGNRIGLVLPVSHRQPDEAVRYAQDIARCYPGAALIIQVCASRMPSAVRTVTEIAAGLNQGRPDGSDLEVSILMRGRPSLIARTRPAPEPPTAARTVEELAFALAPGRQPATAKSGQDELAEQARQFIQVWQETDAGSRPRTTQDILQKERDSLLALVDSKEVEPSLLGAILIEHARSRPDPARSASLLLVSEDDADLDAWLDAAEAVKRPVVPAALPSAAWQAVLLAELRRAGTPQRVRAVERKWLGLIPPVAEAVLGHLASPGRGNGTPAARSAADLAFLESVTDPAVAEVALRAGIGAGLSVADLCPNDGDPLPAAWALLSRGTLDAPTAHRLSRWRPALRRVLGYTLDPVETDPQTRDRVAVLHQSLRPWQWPPPRPFSSRSPAPT